LSTQRKIALSPVAWASLIFVLGAAIALVVASRAQVYIEAGELIPPEVPVQSPLIYFFSAVVILGIVLFFIPITRLRLVFRILFLVLFAWGIFVLELLFVPIEYAVVIALAGGMAWFFFPRVWLHNLLMALALASVGVIFGMAISPWAVLILLGVISIYDIVAVRFGYMLWMANKMSESDALPAFIIPRKTKLWNLDLRNGGFNKLMQTAAGEREFSILGGGDIGFPLVLTVSVFFDFGLVESAVVAVFALAGLISAFLIQQLFLKGKPMPALPPVSAGSLIGFLIVYFVM
jgi:presenilin-like A22 family membrane protease